MGHHRFCGRMACQTWARLPGTLRAWCWEFARTVLTTLALARAYCAVTLKRARSRWRGYARWAPSAEEPKPRVLSVHPAGTDGTADCVEFECARSRRWMAYVAPGEHFDLVACAQQTRAGPAPVILALAHPSSRKMMSSDSGGSAGSEDVTHLFLKFLGPNGDFYGLPPPRVRDIAEFVFPAAMLHEDPSLELFMATAEVLVFGWNDKICIPDRNT